MIRIAVCDDEKIMSDKIAEMASDFFRSKNLETEIFQFSCGEKLLEYDKTIDILFLDIQLETISGMDIARQLRCQKFKGFLIFITVLPEMVFDAFEVQAYDYLVKPVQKNRFKKTMERLLVSMQNAACANLLVQRGRESFLVSLDDIIYCEIIDRKIYLHLTSSSVIDFYDRIENLEQKLDNRFFKCHRSFLINLQYLRGCSSGAAYMESGVEIPISRLRSRELSCAVLEYMKRK